MHNHVTEIFNTDDLHNGVCVVDGYGLRVGVERKRLIVADGLGRVRRTRQFSRADKTLKRIVVIGNSGTISLDALRWLADVRVPLVHIDLEGRVLAVSAIEGTDNPALRRAQGLAAQSDIGLEIARYLLRFKLDGQLRVSRRISAASTMRIIETALEDLADSIALDGILVAEAVAASVYWPSLASYPVGFVRGDLQTVPEHWRSIGQRSSPLSQSARSAVTPANAILNYCYALLAAEARIAALTMGLDPGLGFFHADKANRDSLVADIMEPVRPEVDAFVLDLLGRRTFRAADFVETRQGACRLTAPLTHELAESAIEWQRSVGAVVEHVAQLLATGVRGRAGRVSTPITRRSRAAAARQRLESASELKPVRRAKATANCRSCGGPVPRSDYRYCDACRAERKAELVEQLKVRAAVEHRRKIAEGRDATRTEDALSKQRSAMEHRNSELKTWEEAGNVAPDPEVFRREILPLIQTFSVNRLSKATGLSRTYSLQVRKGEYIPHARHWPAFQMLIQEG